MPAAIYFPDGGLIPNAGRGVFVSWRRQQFISKLRLLFYLVGIYFHLLGSSSHVHF
ncbi:hypothetical protein LINPERHAP1_LOCUS6195 [Linum perenne]